MKVGCRPSLIGLVTPLYSYPLYDTCSLSKQENKKKNKTNKNKLKSTPNTCVSL